MEIKGLMNALSVCDLKRVHYVIIYLNNNVTRNIIIPNTEPAKLLSATNKVIPITKKFKRV